MLDMNTLEIYQNVYITLEGLNSLCVWDLTMVLMTCRLDNQRLLLLGISVAYLLVLVQVSLQQGIVGTDIAALNFQFSTARM